jgi:phenylalanyl-tRNA synthetase beta chain
MSDAYPKPLERRVVRLRPARATALLGKEIPEARQKQLLESLGLEVTGAEILEARVPTFRPDLEREVDLIEEVARLEGYDAFAATVPSLSTMPPEAPVPPVDRVRQALASLGLDEVITFGFVGPKELSRLFRDEARTTPLMVQNPLREEQSAMRTSLVPGLLAALARNVKRGEESLALFEVGRVFFRRSGGDSPALEELHAAAVLTGERATWLDKGAPLDIFDLKGVLEKLVGSHRVDTSNEPYLHPGVQGALFVDGKKAGVFGELHPDRARELGLGKVFLFELHVAALPLLRIPVYEQLPRQPSVERDISFFVAESLSCQSIGDAIAALRGPLVVGYRLLEDYREAGRVPVGKKGMLWSFTYRATDRTLTDAEVNAAHTDLVQGLVKKLDLVLR